LLGALSGDLRREHSQEDALGLHHLLCSTHAGGFGGVLLQACHGLGAVSAIGAGTAVTMLWDVPAVKAIFPPILAERDAIFPALFLAVAAMIVVSFFTPKPAPEQLAKFSD